LHSFCQILRPMREASAGDKLIAALAGDAIVRERRPRRNSVPAQE
jgi:hypothetical protein